MNRQDFHAFTITANGRAGAIITDITVIQASNVPVSGMIIPPTSIFSGKALWDTGATKSVITQRVAQQLKLIPVGVTLVNHAGGQSQSPTHLVDFILPNKVGARGVLVSEMQDSNNFDVLIGMDIITQGDLAITNVNGLTCFSFRFPSIKVIDYVAEANSMTFAGVHRNAPCPCGKTDANGVPVKFKKCDHQRVIIQ